MQLPWEKNGGRNQLYLDFHADWVARDIRP
jgi:hypothetical protein